VETPVIAEAPVKELGAIMKEHWWWK